MMMGSVGNTGLRVSLGIVTKNSPLAKTGG